MFQVPVEVRLSKLAPVPFPFKVILVITVCVVPAAKVIVLPSRPAPSVPSTGVSAVKLVIVLLPLIATEL